MTAERKNSSLIMKSLGFQGKEHTDSKTILWKKGQLWVVNCCRFVLAVVFIFSGFVKGIDTMGFSYKIGDYIRAFGFSNWLPGFSDIVLSFFVSTLEFSLGMLMLFGIKRRATTRYTFWLLCLMTLFTFYVVVANPVSHCGCFGDAIVLTNIQTFLKNIVLLAISFIVYRYHETIRFLLSKHVEWIVWRYVVVFSLILWGWCYHHLPIIDFRPYHIGVNMPEAMGLKPTDKPLSIIDFYAEDPANEVDVTEKIVNQEGYTILLVSPKLEGASEQHIDLINELYDYCLKNEIPFYCLTSSEKEERLDWEDRTGAEYPVYVGDYLGLKTMIRSNPGLVVLKDGNIVNKVANSDIPDEYELQEDINLLPLFHGDVVSLGRLLGTLFLWFFGPLILVLMLDRFLIYRHRHKMEIAKAEEIQKEAASVEQNAITEEDRSKVISEKCEMPQEEEKNEKN